MVELTNITEQHKLHDLAFNRVDDFVVEENRDFSLLRIIFSIQDRYIFEQEVDEDYEDGYLTKEEAEEKKANFVDNIDKVFMPVYNEVKGYALKFGEEVEVDRYDNDALYDYNNNGEIIAVRFFIYVKKSLKTPEIIKDLIDTIGTKILGGRFQDIFEDGGNKYDSFINFYEFGKHEDIGDYNNIVSIDFDTNYFRFIEYYSEDESFEVAWKYFFRDISYNEWKEIRLKVCNHFDNTEIVDELVHKLCFVDEEYSVNEEVFEFLSTKYYYLLDLCEHYKKVVRG